MKRMTILVVLASALAAAVGGVAGADGCPPSTCGTFSAAAPGSRYVTLRPNGHAGPLNVFDVVTRRMIVRLPRGVESADGRRFVSARGTKQQTTVTTYALPTGRQLVTRVLRSRFLLAGVSRTGRRIVLVKPGGERRTTTFHVLDRGTVVERIRLRGMYELETLSPSGDRLFLVHWRNNGYDLRLYDLRAQRLRATPTLEPDGTEEKMVGQAWRGVATRDGRWLLTLYLEGDGGFVHALDLRRGIGHCVDLPARGDAAALGASALVVSPDQRRLFVASPLLGRVFTIDLRRPHVSRVARFTPWLSSEEFSGIGPNGAISPTGRTVFFNGNGLLWALDTASARVRGPYPTRRLVAGLGFTPDGKRVVAFSWDGRSRVLDAATGVPVRA
jgi:hypothetical protein